MEGLDMEVKPLVFALNGEKMELTNVDPSTTLLSYLRERTQFKGTKYGCGEGGCGACVVLLSKYDSSTRQVEEFTVNSCLIPLGSISECSILTTEGLGNSRDGFHSIHKRLAGFHASQCGFCTPGMTMAIYGALRRQQNHHFQSKGFNKESEVPELLPEINSWNLEKAILGNLCRCTGYRPIVDACKSFAKNVDLEDLGLNSFCSALGSENNPSLPPYIPNEDPCFPAFLIPEPKPGDPESNSSELHRTTIDEDKRCNLSCIAYIPSKNARLDDASSCTWLTPHTLKEAFCAIDAYKEQNNFKIVVGNTSTGLFKNTDAKVYIDLSHVPELLIIKETEHGIEVGAAVCISNLIDSLEYFQNRTLDCRIEEMELHEGRRSFCVALASHLNKLGTPHVRNKASVGGNLIMAQRWSFNSDLATILLGAGASIQLGSLVKERVWQPIEEFLQEGLPNTLTLLLSVFIPYPEAINDNVQGVKDPTLFLAREPLKVAAYPGQSKFQTYRAAPRPFGNALSDINAAFFLHFSSITEAKSNDKHVIERVRLAFGVLSGAHAFRAGEVEEFLRGKVISGRVILDATLLLKRTLVVGDEVRKSRYRCSVACGFLYKFLAPLAWDNNRGLSDSSENGFKQLPKQHLLLTKQKDRICTGVENDSLRDRDKDFTFIKGRQKLKIVDHLNPVGLPATKIAAELQASGEAVYVDDIPSPRDCLYASFVCSERALGKIKNINLTNALASPGVVSFISAMDIPSSGQNIGTATGFSYEKLFATDTVEYIGQPVGLIVADTSHRAKVSAQKVEVEYDTQFLEEPTISIEDAIAKGSFFELWALTRQAMQPLVARDISKGLTGPDIHVESGEVRTGSQYFFYLENQTTLAVPDEDNCLVIYSACQGPEYVQKALSLCLGIPMHNIRVITRRVGGGFGGKALRAMLVATACGLAAYKLKRPVHLSLDRSTDMKMMGGRHATKTVYKVGFRSDGKVTALQAKIYVQAGWSEDMSPFVPAFIYKTLKKYNWEVMDVDLLVCRTNLPCRTAMRAPGDTQGSFIADTIIEHVAGVLGLDASEVIERNMHSVESAGLFYGPPVVGGLEGFTLPAVWEKLMTSARIKIRQENIKVFNSENRWVKRGLGLVSTIYKITVLPRPGRVSIFSDGSIVVEVGGVDIGQGLYTKVQQTVSYALSKLWQGGRGVPISLIKIVQADSISLPNGGLTNNSSTSEATCGAVLQACEILVDRLNPVKQKLEHGHSDGVTWDLLIQSAKYSGVDLSAQVLLRISPEHMQYLTFGAAASEVEVDLLTGQTTILKTDLVYDCGNSMNPAVDIGQVEGAFMQGIGFVMTEDYVIDEHGKLLTDGTWTYKPPSVDNSPREFNIELLNSPTNQKRILSSKASGEPPLLLASSVHGAIRSAIKAAREYINLDTFSNVKKSNREHFQLDAPATMEKIKNLCEFDNVELYLQSLDKNNDAFKSP